MTWIYYALVAAVGMAAADIFVKIASDKVPTSIGLVCYGGCSFLAGLIWLAIEVSDGSFKMPGLSGWMPALGVGLAFTVVTICMYTAFRIGAPISSGLASDPPHGSHPCCFGGNSLLQGDPSTCSSSWAVGWRWRGSICCSLGNPTRKS